MKLASFLLLSSFVVISGCAVAPDEDVAESEASIMSCRADESARRADVRNTSRIAGVVSDVVGAKVTCSASTAIHRIDQSASDAYFGAAVRCDVARVCKLDPASFTAAMEKRGFYGWDLVDGVVVGETTSRSYRSCTALPRGETACQAGATNTARLEGLIWASLGSRATCTAGAPKTIATGNGDHYYSADVTCTVASTRESASFAGRMASFGWNGYQLSGSTITGTQTSRVCSSYADESAAAD
jgi:hypothetical protein